MYSGLCLLIRCTGCGVQEMLHLVVRHGRLVVSVWAYARLVCVTQPLIRLFVMLHLFL